MVDIYLNEVQTDGSASWLNMTVSNGLDVEQFALPVTQQTALTLQVILQEEPFSPNKPGVYQRMVKEVSEGIGHPFMLTLEISKGRSRVKRNVSVEREMFLELWNILHYQVPPSQLPTQRRT